MTTKEMMDLARKEWVSRDIDNQIQAILDPWQKAVHVKGCSTDDKEALNNVLSSWMVTTVEEFLEGD